MKIKDVVFEVSKNQVNKAKKDFAWIHKVKSFKDPGLLTITVDGYPADIQATMTLYVALDTGRLSITVEWLYDHAMWGESSGSKTFDWEDYDPVYLYLLLQERYTPK